MSNILISIAHPGADGSANQGRRKSGGGGPHGLDHDDLLYSGGEALTGRISRVVERESLVRVFRRAQEMVMMMGREFVHFI